MDIAQLGIKVDSAMAVKATGDLDKLTAAGGRADVAVAGVGKASVRAAGGMSAGATNARMMALQLSQVAQQSMAGGGFIRALAIQLPDMAVGFGAVGIAAGIVAGVALPLLASALFGASEKSATLVDAMQTLGGSFDAYQKYATVAATSTADLAVQFGDFAGQVRGFSEYLAGVALGQTFDDLKATVLLLNEPLASVQGQFANIAMMKEQISKIPLDDPESILRAQEAIGLYQSELASAAAQLGIMPEQARQLAIAIDAVGLAKGPTELANAASQALAVISRIAPEGQKLPGPLRDAANALGEMAERAAETSVKSKEVSAATTQAASASARLAGIMAGAYAVYAQTRGMATELANETERAARAAASIASYEASGAATGLTGPDGARSSLRGGGRFTPVVSGAGLARPVASGGGGGGGGGATDDFAARLAMLQTEHETETAQANKWYADAQTVLADRRAIEILGAQGHKAKLQEIETIHQQQIAAINANAQAARLSQTAGLFGALASIAEAGGKKSAKAVATFQAIEGTINAYGAALKALNTPGITLAGRFAAYASVLGAGLKGVAAIRSAGGVGGGGGGRNPAAQGVPQDGAQTRLVVQGIKLTDLLTGEMLMNILGKEFGARNVEFTR